jgi:hypothetical protein
MGFRPPAFCTGTGRSDADDSTTNSRFEKQQNAGFAPDEKMHTSFGTVPDSPKREQHIFFIRRP